MAEKVNYQELEQKLREDDFTAKEIDDLTNWWAYNWDWLLTASADEIRKNSQEALI